MPTFFSDPSTAEYAILALAALVLGGVAARRQKKADVILFGVVAALLAAVAIIDFAVESPRETVVRTLKEMEAASQAKKYDDLFKHVSEKFQYKALDKKGLREMAKLAETQSPEGMRIWNTNRANFKLIDDNTIEQEFDVQPVNAPQYRHQCVGVFKKEADGEWRLTTFRLYSIVSGGEGPRQEVSPPGM
ncbi:MAG TPA: hypothetical protein VHR66_22400 [Gemmataceae bacterium]|jgi:hypothetical protein|nr:hypothetical protein [Gemmataceae bacterium]